ncbi:MAG: oxidoreductase [Candidatus Levybacteria bacterium]|nr:oxidoreductase [Candidatus Levybacteria bacterium]
MQYVDRILNGITMYRLMLYCLILLFCIAIIFSILKIIPYNSLDILAEGLYLISLCFVANQILARIFKVRPNFESQFITGIILALIIGPLPLQSNLFFLTVAPTVAMASKYLINYQKQHIFNPAAFAVVITAILFLNGASWWIGNLPMFPFIALAGLLILRKINRFNMVFSFLITYFLFIVAENIQSILIYSSFLTIMKNVFIFSPLLFFSIIMLTEPITSPADKKLRIYYGIFTALVFIFLQKLIPVSFTLELSLLIANLGGRIIRFNTKYILILKEKNKIAPSIWKFIFEPQKPFQYIAGQFIEWSLPHINSDSRGTRRYFTISSSPSEKDIILTVRIPEDPSSFKTALKKLPIRESIYATSLEGDFILPENQDRKLIFIAGGIGITPFRSIIKYLLDKKDKRDIVLFYACSDASEFAYDEIFKQAEKELNLKYIPILSQKAEIPQRWNGKVGHITKEMIKDEVPDYKERFFYISGPLKMVDGYKKLLLDMGVSKKNIITDYFPGY